MGKKRLSWSPESQKKIESELVNQYLDYLAAREVWKFLRQRIVADVIVNVNGDLNAQSSHAHRDGISWEVLWVIKVVI